MGIRSIVDLSLQKLLLSSGRSIKLVLLLVTSLLLFGCLGDASKPPVLAEAWARANFDFLKYPASSLREISFSNLRSDIASEFRFFELCLHDNLLRYASGSRCNELHLLALAKNGGVIADPTLNDLLRRAGKDDMAENEVVKLSKAFVEVEYFKAFANYIDLPSGVLEVNLLFPSIYTDISVREGDSVVIPANYSSVIVPPKISKEGGGFEVELFSVHGGVLVKWNLQLRNGTFSLANCEVVGANVGEPSSVSFLYPPLHAPAGFICEVNTA